jgi:signal transduction histidine kinase
MILDSRRSFDPGRGSIIAILLTIAFAYIAALVQPGPALGGWAWAALLALGGLHIALYFGVSHGAARMPASLQVVLFCILQLAVCGAIQYVGQGHFWLLLLPLASNASFMLSRRVMAVFLLGILAVFLLPLGLNNFSDYLQQAVIFGSALVFVLVFTEVAIHERQVRSEKEALAVELEAANRRLRDYAAQAEELARTRERNRLAREIHDSLGHSLTVVNVQLEAAKALAENRGWKEAAPEVYAALEKAQSLTRGGLSDIRRSVAALRSEAAGDKTLRESITALLSASEQAGLVITFQNEGIERRLPPAVELTLFRTAQEALTNVRKHACASQVDIVLFYLEASVRMVVRDNGVGMPAAETSRAGKFGLLGLQERADLLHGRFAVESSPGSGTAVTMELPILESA